MQRLIESHRRMPTLVEYLEYAYLGMGNIPRPIDAEGRAMIPDEIRDQFDSLPVEFREETGEGEVYE
jgi:hypothetical protein